MKFVPFPLSVVVFLSFVDQSDGGVLIKVRGDCAFNDLTDPVINCDH